MSILEKIADVVRTASPERPRCPTPLRPNAGLVGRIPGQNERPTTVSSNNQFDEIPFATLGGSTASKPSRRQVGKPPRADAESAATTTQQEENRGGVVVTKEQLRLFEECNFTIHDCPSEDAFSVHEKSVVSEVNLLRGDPAGYALYVERDATISRPFVPSSMTLTTLSRYSEGLQAQRDSAQQQLDDLMNLKKKEIGVLNTEWVAEDLDRAKKAKKGAPKKGATPDPEMDEGRLEVLQKLEKRFAGMQKDLSKSLEVASQAYSAASQGIKVMRDCIAKLRGITSPLSSLQYNRGLSLAARKLCTEPPAAPMTANELKDLAKRYGEVGERVVVAQHEGVVSIRQLVMEILMGLQDPARKASRNAILEAGMTFVGCGWRKRDKSCTVTTLLLSSGFEELDAIYSRPHMPLDEVRRLLPQSSAAAPVSSSSAPTRPRPSLSLNVPTSNSQVSTSSSKTFVAPGTTIIKLQTSLAVSLISPTSHPMTCDNEATVLLQVAPDVRVCASLISDNDPTPSIPSSGCGNVFVQNTCDDGVVEIRTALPSRGSFRLVLFARSTTQPSTPYRNIGSVRLLATRWHSSNIVPPYPVVTSDFDDRRCTLIGPLTGQLLPGGLYTFEVMIPRTTYLQQDIQRIDHALQETISKYASPARLNATNAAAAAAQSGADEVSPQRPASRGPTETSSPLAADGSIAVNDVETPPSELSPLEVLMRDIDEAKRNVVAAQKRVQDDCPVIATEIATQTRDMAKKKGKELDRAKLQIAELESQIEEIQASVAIAERRVKELEEKVIQQRRAEKRAAAQIQRFQREKQMFEDAASRDHPLSVQLSLEERRSDFVAIDHEHTVYRLETRVPVAQGPVTIFVNGLATIMFTVAE